MKVVAILGTYRKGGVIDCAVDRILEAAREEGALVEKIYLIDQHIEFCTNCRTCTQQPGDRHGQCPVRDDMSALLDTIENADAFVLASPMNFWTVTAVTKTFVERLVCFAYWPWGVAAPKTRNVSRARRAIVVASSAAPVPLARIGTRMVGLMKSAARLLGAGKIDVLFIGLAAQEQHQKLSSRVCKRARRLGTRLAR